MHTIEVPEELYTLLEHRAAEQHTSPDALVAEALRRYLQIDQQSWDAQFQHLLATVQARIAEAESDAIEADISLAANESRELRRERRRTD